MVIQEFPPYTEQTQNWNPVLVRAEDINADLLQEIYSFYDRQSAQTLGSRLGGVTTKEAFPKDKIYSAPELQWMGVIYDWDHKTILGIGELIEAPWPALFTGHMPQKVYDLSATTDERHIRQGIGFAIASSLIEKTKAEGVNRIHTESRYDNVGAKKLLESLKSKHKIRDLFSRENPYTNTREHLLVL